jgi:hypothetical protein
LERFLKNQHPKETIILTLALVVLGIIEFCGEFVSPTVEQFFQIKERFPLIMTSLFIVMIVIFTLEIREIRAENQRFVTRPFTLRSSSLDQNKAYAHLLMKLSANQCHATHLFQKVPCKKGNRYVDIAESTIERGTTFRRIITVESAEEIQYARYLCQLQEKHKTFKVKVLKVRADFPRNQDISPLLNFTVQDDQAVFVAHPRLVGDTGGGVVIFDEQIAKGFLDYFNALWGSSQLTEDLTPALLDRKEKETVYIGALNI